MERSLPCVWMRAGVLDYRLCDREYRCEDCPLDRAIRRSPAGPQEVSVASPASSPLLREHAGTPGPCPAAGFDLPTGIFYAPWHVWARIEGGGRVRVGLDDFAQRLVGRIYAVDLPRRGARVHRYTSTWRVAHAAGETVVRVPVTGVVREVNERLLAEPSLANRDPYGLGAAFVVEPSRLSESVRSLRYGEEAHAWCEAEASRLREELVRLRPPSPSVGPTLQDGGIPSGDLAAILEPEDLRTVIRSFLCGPAPSRRNLAKGKR